MGIPIREHTIEQIRTRTDSMATSLNKINYLESAMKVSGFTFEIKRFIYGELAMLYEERKYFERAAKILVSKASVGVTKKEKMSDYISAAELFSRAGKVEDADNVFVMALRESGDENKQKVKLARKNIYLKCARELESKMKRASAVKFYEKLYSMNLEATEKSEIKDKLFLLYKALGMFHEAKLLGENKK